MTETLATTEAAPARGAAATRPTRARLIVCWVTVAAMLPYLCLKLSWLSGSTIGTNGPDVVDNSTLQGLNVITLGMDCAALVVALTLTYRWGLRVPAWLLVLPMWIATGFLGTIAVAAPSAAIATVVTGAHPAAGAIAPVQGWVYAVVYTGFAAQGVGLTTAFVLHLRARRPQLFTARLSDLRLDAGPTAAVRRVLVNGLSVPVLLVAAVDLYWAGGGTAGLTAADLADRTAGDQAVNAAYGLLALAAAVGPLLLVRPNTGNRRALPALVAAWLGTGSLFAWGLWDEIVTALQPFEPHETALTATPLTMLTGYFQALAGALLATVVLLALVEGSAGPATLRPKSPA